MMFWKLSPHASLGVSNYSLYVYFNDSKSRNKESFISRPHHDLFNKDPEIFIIAESCKVQTPKCYNCVQIKAVKINTKSVDLEWSLCFEIESQYFSMGDITFSGVFCVLLSLIPAEIQAFRLQRKFGRRG